MVDEYTPPDRRARVNLDPGHEPAELRHETRDPAAVGAPAGMRDAVEYQRVQARVTREDFPGAAGGGIALADRGDVFAESREHGSEAVVGIDRRRALRGERAAGACAVASAVTGAIMCIPAGKLCL
ncbi:hypothetical protein BCAR13_390015 [Paraburkholderia caribensis]|nr:hypothetical protein BCAR13_390015 [Paraburkholderia caribensis]